MIGEIKYVIGEVYPFVVEAVRDGFCELVDECGLKVYLQHTNRYKLFKGQTIRCRVLDTTKMRPKIKLEDDETVLNQSQQLTEPAVKDYLRETGIAWNDREFLRLLLMDESDIPFEEECRKWIRQLNSAKVDLKQVRTDCTKLLEESNLLGQCSLSEREQYQGRLTLLIENLGYYIKANELLEQDEAIHFVDNLFDKLSKSGFVYHPAKNFNIMSSLFLSDPKLMESETSKLCDVLRKWPVDNWKRNPFKSALVKVLESHVNENIWRIDKVGDNKPLLRNLVQTLTILLLLYDRENSVQDEAATRIALSRMCALATYYRPDEAQATLQQALVDLLGKATISPQYDLSETGQGSLSYRFLAAKAAPLNTTNVFYRNNAKLEVSDAGIILNVGLTKKPTALIPSSIKLWGQLQVMADKEDIDSLPKSPKIPECHRMWANVERMLFAPDAKDVPTKSQKKKHHVEDIVNIKIVRQDAENPKKFYCRIADDIGGEGFIFLHEIIPYTLDADVRLFQSDDNNKPLLFEARIIEKEDEGFHFVMADIVKEYAEEYYNDDEEFLCLLQTDMPANGKGTIPAISAEGFSVAVSGFDEVELEGAKKGDVARVKFLCEGYGSFHVKAKIKEIVPDEEIYMTKAFHVLMNLYAIDEEKDVEDAEYEEKDLEQDDKIMDPTDIREIIRIIDRMSVIDSEYVKAYNYLGFAHVLCMLIGWEERAAYYKGRMDLIALLADFATNDRVDEEQLEKLIQTNDDIMRNNTMIDDYFMQLKTVSLLGKQDSNAEIWETYRTRYGVVREIASLVLAYNMMSLNHMQSQCTDVRNRIKEKLKFKGYESNLKIYGDGLEGKEIEFKTSIVFPPDNGMRPNMQKQMGNILRVVASFLNTNGGVLYVGVNDTGAGVGVERDLQQPEFYMDKDKYQRAILDAATMTWGNVVSAFIDIAYDKANKEKDVLIVEVRPYPIGVALKDKYFIRSSSTIRGLTEAEFAMYNEQRTGGGEQAPQTPQEDAPAS